MNDLKWVAILSERYGREDLRGDPKEMYPLFSFGSAIEGANGRWTATVWGPRWEEPPRDFATLREAKAHIFRRVQAQRESSDDLRAGFKVAK